MSSVRIIILKIFIVSGILLNHNIVCAQLSPILDSLIYNTTLRADTSAYLPVFYAGALDYNLMIAASNGYSSEIIRLLEKGADINGKTNEGVTPLVFAVLNNRLYAVNTILSFNPEINVVTNQFETPLLIAVKNQYFEVTEALLRTGADIDYSDRYGATPLHYATIYDYPDIVDLLLYYDAEIDSKTKDGTTPLIASIWAGYADIADLLIQNGANLEARDKDGFTPFLMAAYYGDTLLMNLLYKNGVDIYVTNKSKHNALTLTIMRNQKEATEFLLRLGDKWNEGTEVLSPYSVATKYSRKDILGILEKHGIPGHLKYEVDQIALTLSSRFCLYDLYSGFSLSFKEPFLKAGFITGLDTKLWYSRVLLKDDEHLLYQYMDKGSVVYAGFFKDFVLKENTERFSSYISASLMAGYSFGNKFKGTLNSPENKFLAIPSVSLKVTKMNFTFNAGVEYVKSPFHYMGPFWVRIGCSYNYYFDNVRTRVKDLKWYK